jgi:hypothetical protein
MNNLSHHNHLCELVTSLLIRGIQMGEISSPEDENIQFPKRCVL